MIKNRMGSGEANDLICMSHGHELQWGNDDGRGGYRREGEKFPFGRKKMGQLEYHNQ